MKCYTSVATATEERLTERPWAVVTSSGPMVWRDPFARAACLRCHEADEGNEYGEPQHCIALDNGKLASRQVPSLYDNYCSAVFAMRAYRL